MMMKVFPIVLLVAVLYASSVLGDGEPIPFTTSGGVVYETEGSAAVPPDYCENCVSYYEEDNGKDNGYFRYSYRDVTELDANGNECCTASPSCPANVGCNNHVISDFASVFAVTQSPDAISFTAALSANRQSSNPNCVPPGSGGIICSNFVFSYAKQESEQNVTVALNQNMTLAKSSFRGKVKISNWPFYSTSKGLRIRVQVSCQNTRIDDFILQPGDIATSYPPVATSGFDSVYMIDRNGHTGAVTFSHYAIVDNNQNGVKINVTGPYQHPYDTSARFFYVDVPKFSSSVEWNSDIFVPSVSNGFSDAPSMCVPTLATMLLASACVGGLCNNLVH